MPVHWGTLIVGVIIGFAVGQMLMRVNSGGSTVQIQPS